jgi:signal transduction histidine kinase
MITSALITGAILLGIYFLTRSFGRADLVASLVRQTKLEAYHYATRQQMAVDSTFEFTDPATSIFSADGKLLYTRGSDPIAAEPVAWLNQNTSFLSRHGNWLTVGRKYTIKRTLYLVFVSDKRFSKRDEFRNLIKGIVVGWVAGLVLSYLAGLYFSRNALNPVNRVVREVNQITKDNLSYRLRTDGDTKSTDEIGELILTFNALLTRIENAFIAQKRFVQNASHELKTPLTAIMAEAELALARERSQAEYKRTMEVITQETERLATITHGLLSLARLEEGSVPSEMEKVDIQALIQDTLTTFALHHPGRKIIEETAKTKIIVRGNAQLLQIALLNVLDNAAKYSADKIIFRTTLAADSVSIVIQDFGIGIPDQELSRLLSPLFRGSNVTRFSGAGLGLPLVDRIVTVHSGKLTIQSKEGNGTICEINFPVSP